ncbi:MAG: hypothetical protein KAS04_05940 [Candidatus Aenigmarchaeota archaeon]|nr:hypothetical protein [Candidatus Aenigmarchaeota archaeon]
MQYFAFAGSLVPEDDFKYMYSNELKIEYLVPLLICEDNEKISHEIKIIRKAINEIEFYIGLNLNDIKIGKENGMLPLQLSRLHEVGLITPSEKFEVNAALERMEEFGNNIKEEYKKAMEKMND